MDPLVVATIVTALGALVGAYFTFISNGRKLRQETTYQYVESGVRSLEAALGREDEDVRRLAKELEQARASVAQLRKEIFRLQDEVFIRDQELIRYRRTT